jgi:hypothetical protein
MELSLSSCLSVRENRFSNGCPEMGIARIGLLLHLKFSSFTGQAGRGTNVAIGTDEQNADLSRASCWHEFLKLKDGVHVFLVPFEIAT